MRLPFTISALLLLAACDDDARPPSLAWVTPHPLVAEPGRHDVAVVETRAVVPGPGLPAEVALGQSNNNLDVVRHEGRVYLAFRTAPDHFAGTETKLYVVSSADELAWDLELEVALGTDLREPRLLSIDGKLLFFFSLLGANPLKFEPGGVRFVEKGPSGWGAIETYASDDRIVWRTQVHAGRAYVSEYTGGEHIYLFDGLPLDVDFLTSTDGRTWEPVGPEATIYTGGASETAFAWSASGDLYFVLRVEAYDASGVGSKICVAPGGDVTRLYCRSDPKKYDSPLLFEHDGEVYLVGRRNLSASGYYGDPTYDYSYPDPGAVLLAQLDYWGAPKRCALWRIVPGDLRVAYLQDLPSNGDTCFPSAIPGASADEVILYDYSSDPAGGDLSWMEGQEGPTSIYRHVLRFTRR